MISVTKLLFGTEYFGDSLRYHNGQAKGCRTEGEPGTGIGHGPVVVWNSTRTCNLKCKHCYMNSDEQRYDGELTTEEAMKMIDELSDAKAPVLLFSGGEPLLRKDFFKLAAYAKEKGLRPTLSTNGTLITKEVAQKIKDIGVGYVGVSLDGLQEKNDFFRGKDGAFNAAVSGIRNCVEVGQRVGLRFTINRHNYEELDRIFAFIEEEKINRVCFYHLVYSGRGEQMKEEDITPEETRHAMDQIIDWAEDLERRGLKKEILTVDNHADGVYLYLKAKNENPEKGEAIKKLIGVNGGNRCGVAFCEIDPFGNVHPDQFSQHITFGNIRERSFLEIWKDESHEILKGLRNRKPLLKGRCGSCDYLSFCNGNFRTRAEAIFGNFWAEDPACYLTDVEIGLK